MGGGSGGGRRSSCCSSSSSSSSSGEEDGDADWRAAIDSVATTTTNGLGSTTSNGPTSNSIVHHPSQHDQADNPKSQIPKHYQIKAHTLLGEILEKTIEVVRGPLHATYNDPVLNDGGIRLFKRAPPGIVFDHLDELQGPEKRPRILPGKEIDEKSKKFRRQLQSVAVDGVDIMSAARDACQKSLDRLKVKDEATKAAAKREEERVAELKRIRGERWLPSIARDMQTK